MLAKAPNDSAFVRADVIRSACIKGDCWRTMTLASVACATRVGSGVAAIRHLDLRGLTGLVDER